MTRRKIMNPIELGDRAPLDGIIRKAEDEITFTPGSKDRLTVDIDEFSLVVRAARDTVHELDSVAAAQNLYETALPVLELLDRMPDSKLFDEFRHAVNGFEEHYIADEQ